MGKVKPTRLIAGVQQMVASHYGLTVEQMLAKTNRRAVSKPRQQAMWLCRRCRDLLDCRAMDQLSYPVIGRHFKDRDHTTVLHGVEAIEQERHTNAELDNFLAECMAAIMRSFHVVD